MTPKLYLDEDISPELARLLRAHGYDVVSAHERGLLGAPDDEHLAVAAAEGHALVTFNYDDFLALGDLWWFAEREHAVSSSHTVSIDARNSGCSFVRC